MGYNKKVPTTTGFLDTPPAGYQRSFLGMPLPPKEWNENGGFNIPRFTTEAMNTLGQERGFGLDAEREGYQAFRDFDPTQAFKQYTDATLHQTGAALGDELTRMAGQAVGSGRLHTGFFDRDQGDTARRFYSDANDRINQAAMQTTGMRQQQLAGLLDFGTQARNRYFDLLYGNFDRAQGNENAQGGFGVGDALQLGAQVLPFVL